MKSYYCKVLLNFLSISLPLFLFSVISGSVQADNNDPYTIERKSWMKQANTGTVRIITKGLGCTCTNIASDMSKVLNELGQMRILPVLGTGSLQGIADILYLDGIDLSILQSDVLAYVKRNKIHSNIESRIRYITKLHNSELHLIAGEGIKSLKDLEGKTVSFDAKGRGSFITAQNVFASVGIKVKPVRIERDKSIQMVRTGELAAVFVVTGKPASSMKKITPGDGLHFLPVPMNEELKKSYISSQFTHKDYPNLIPQGETITTIAIGEVLAVYNWQKKTKRYEKTAAFVNAFFDSFSQLQKPIYHKKWKEVDLNANVPGWTRFPAATLKLQQMLATTITEARFKKFSDKNPKIKNLSHLEQRKLYQQFLEWSQEKN